MCAGESGPDGPIGSILSWVRPFRKNTRKTEGECRSSCSDGNITAVKVDGDKLTVVQTIPTSRGARAMTLDPATHKIDTAAQNFQPPDPNAPPPAAGARGRGPAPVPDSFRVLIYNLK